MNINLENFTLTVLALNELQSLGYKEVWIGPTDCSHWDWCVKGNIVASPKNKIGSFPSIWSVSEKLFGQKSAGNGLKNADQMQRINSELISGYYKLVNNKWESNIFEK